MSNSNMETEFVVYAEITKPEGLRMAHAVYEQEQLEGNIGHPGQRCRVRKETRDGVIAYTFTYKLPIDNDGMQQFIEHTTTIDEAFWNDFRHVAKKRLRKKRYEFLTQKVTFEAVIDGQKVMVELPELKYEVDVYFDKDGRAIKWCKIDLELDSMYRHIKEHYGQDDRDIRLSIKYSHLPFAPEGMISNKTKDPEQLKFLSNLWEQHFNLPA